MQPQPQPHQQSTLLTHDTYRYNRVHTAAGSCDLPGGAINSSNSDSRKPCREHTKSVNASLQQQSTNAANSTPVNNGKCHASGPRGRERLRGELACLTIWKPLVDAIMESASGSPAPSPLGDVASNVAGVVAVTGVGVVDVDGVCPKPVLVTTTSAVAHAPAVRAHADKSLITP